MAYVVLESSVRTHRKMLAAGPAACWLWVCGLGHCQEGLTDGHIPESALLFLGVSAVEAPILADVLVKVKLWDRVDDGWQVHDYHEHNKSADEVRRIMRARAEGGKLGGRPKTSKDNLEGKQVSPKPKNLPRNPSGTSGTSVPSESTVRTAGAESPSATPPSPCVLTFPTTGPVKTWGLTEAHVQSLQDAYDTLNVRAECRRALVWLQANPGRTKTAKGMPQFLAGWMNRAVKDGVVPGPRAVPHLPARQPDYVDWTEECDRHHGGTSGSACGSQYKHGMKMKVGA